MSNYIKSMEDNINPITEVEPQTKGITDIKDCLFQLTEDIQDLTGNTDLFVPHNTVVQIVQDEKKKFPIVQALCEEHSKYSFPVKWDQIRLVQNHAIYED